MNKSVLAGVSELTNLFVPTVSAEFFGLLGFFSLPNLPPPTSESKRVALVEIVFAVMSLLVIAALARR